MNDLIFYCMSGRAHLPYLVVSLHTLRRYYQGRVRVIAWEESWPIVRRIWEDPRLKIEASLSTPEYRGKNAQFLHKIDLAQALRQDADRLLYLDADTLLRDSPQPILDAVAGGRSFAVTQFNDWTTGSSVIRGRVNELWDVPGVNQRAVAACLNGPLPSVNGGIWACRPDSPVLPTWRAWTWAAREKFIADEKVLHVMQAEYPAEVAIMAGGRWNASPKYSRLPDAEVALWHGHGDSFTRPSKSAKGAELWLPIFREVVEGNVGGIQEWPSIHCDNRFLKALLND